MSEPIKDLVVPGNAESITVPSKSSVCVPIKNKMPGITILVHGVNDIGEAYPHQEEGICAGLNDRLRRSDIQPAKYEMPPPPKNGEKFTAAEVNPDPDRVYFQRKPELGTSPVIPFYWGFREEKNFAKTEQHHGQYVDRFGNRIDKRFGKNGGPFANATTNIPDMFGPGFQRNWMIRRVDPEGATHPLMTAPARTYMVLAAQRLASLIRIIRSKSKNEPINIVAHSQGGFVTLLAHAILAKDFPGIKADTVVLNNTPYSLEEPFAETFQTGDEQQTSHAREETLRQIVAEYITKSPATEPVFATLKTEGEGVVGKEWAHNANKERDNRGKVYLYFSPDDGTVGLPNIQGIGWWGVYDGMLKKLGSRFFQRVFASPRGATTGAPDVGTEPYNITLHFKWNAGFTAPRKRTINAEGLVVTFQPDLGADVLMNGPIDAAIAVSNPYDKKGNEGRRATESEAEAHARWLNRDEPNSFHSSIVSQAPHSQKATAYDLCIGISKILDCNDLTWMQFLRAAADWRTNWKGTNRKDDGDPSFAPPPQTVLAMLNSGEVGSAERDIVWETYNYYCIGGSHPGVLPTMTSDYQLAHLHPYVTSETVAQTINDGRMEPRRVNGKL